MTLCWRELDSNLRFRARAGWILPVRFAADSLLEGGGFEPSVPLVRRVPEWFEKGARALCAWSAEAEPLS